MNIKTLIIRTLSGAVYVALIVFAILMQNSFIFAAVFGALSALTTYEFHKLTNRQENVDVLAWMGAVCSFLMFVTVFLLYSNSGLIHTDYFYAIVIVFFYIFSFFAASITEIFRKKQNPLHNIAYFIFGQIYIALPFVFFTAIIFLFSPLFLLSLFVIIWINDTFAYLIGSWIGKHRLFERISPKKSWEGFIGGLAGTLIVVYFLQRFLPDKIFDGYVLDTWQWLVFTAVIILFGTLGDLFESLIKRTVGVKDSGNIMPGHGGFLDRLDSVMFAAMPALLFLLLVL